MNRMEKLLLMQENQKLFRENLELKNTISTLEEQLNNMNVTLSLEETIKGFRKLNEAEQEASKPKDLFASLFDKPDTDDDGDGNAEDMMNPNAFGNAEYIAMYHFDYGNDDIEDDDEIDDDEIDDNEIDSDDTR